MGKKMSRNFKVIGKIWVKSVVVATGAVLLSACAQIDQKAEESPTRIELDTLSEGEFVEAMDLEQPAAMETTVPAGPAQPARFYTVLFDLSSESLNDPATQIVEQIADEWGSGSAELVVVGHADSSGSRAYNQKLSERRAKAVRDALVELGIDASRVKDGGAGETELLVPTGDGVSDQHNRRVTIAVE